MKKIAICLIFILLLTLFVTGCNDTSGQPIQDPSTESVDIPTLEELIEINDLENVFKDHTNVYINIESRSSMKEYSYTEEVIYLKGDAGPSYHKRSQGATDTSYKYMSLVGNAFYYTDAKQTVSILSEGEDAFFDYTLDFRSTPVGKGYIDNGQIVYHSYCIYEADEIFEASRQDFTLYFNKDTKLIERMDYVNYTSDHQIETEYFSTITYSVENIENKFDKTAYDNIMNSENRINLEIVANYGTPEQTSYSFVSTTDSQVYASFNNFTYLLYSDPACQNLVEVPDAYSGEESVTLYAKIME